MKVLADTSVWIDFFNNRESPVARKFADFLTEDQIVLCLPVITEILSGKILPGDRKQMERLLNSLSFLDCDWNSQTIWLEMANLADIAHSKRTKIPGIVDRMLILAAKHGGACLWSQDAALINLARHAGVNLL